MVLKCDKCKQLKDASELAKWSLGGAIVCKQCDKK